MLLMQNSYIPAPLVLAGTWNWMPRSIEGSKTWPFGPTNLSQVTVFVPTTTGDGP
jgi:hypothetical protein